MSRQFTDQAVASLARKKDATTDALKRVLRRQGIRDPHTSRKAREAIRIAAQARWGKDYDGLSRSKQIAMGVKR